jgi:ApbE superfamily uncharacterized protein (UPF0280 family)
MYKERAYRGWVKSGGLVTFEVKEAQTDLWISADRDLAGQARQSVLNLRKAIEDYIRVDGSFYTALEPVSARNGAPAIISAMAEAAAKAGVGPFAAVAGAVAEFVGQELSALSREVIVENGGDIFMKTSAGKRIGIYAGEASPFTGKLVLEIPPAPGGIGVCTSSGTVSHSLHFGNADAVCMISDSTALADAAATAAGNAVKDARDIEKGIAVARSIDGIKGALIVFGDRLASWGDIRLA